MSKQYETGNAKNVANLQKLIEQVTVYTAYNPPVDNLKIVNLNTLYTNSLNAITEVEEKRNANKNAIHTRQQAYLNLKSTSTRIINQLEILGLSEGVLAQAKSLNNLIQGSKKKKKEVDKETGEEKKTASTSRQSYTQLADNFSKILQLLATIPTYNPNLEELKLVNLTAYHTTLVESTKNVDITEAELNTKLIERNKILYENGTGLYAIAQNVKKYVKSIYGATSPEYSNISKIKFTSS
ncbi:hypothetical protein JL193_01515 [Polaribacter batillariae]|uniref:Uncharacterized protein n=1 Tax=Polaribacter batillariae TaxID=2808900 RepID=A0ABX7SYE0_9FLAO|nr:hypothetical protein [Polaribacter batillariae]QTD38011.1 hypothetical protein JL193_01515 [Polaribacter batillariae]